MSLTATLPSYHQNWPAPSQQRRKDKVKAPESTESIASQATSSSTPHAPRAKKLLLVRPDLTKNHTYNDTSLLMSPPQSEVVHSVSAQQAWDTETVLVQPFRRTRGRTAPLCVPCLDLSKFNKPDSKMDLVKLHHTATMTTDRSLWSWGNVPITDVILDTSDDVGSVTDVLEVEDVDGASNVENIPTNDKPQNLSNLDSTQARFVVSKLLSNERGKPEPTSQTCVLSSASGPAVYHGQPVKKILGQEGEHIVKDRLMVPEVSLSKKLRFEARVITQNGRDIHRELCGFFFQTDNSIAIYEYRQFGQRSSALPMIQRKIYRHMFGPFKGDPYDINIIKKGFILHFRPCDHSGLPDTLSRRPVLALRITYVDESAKKQLLTEGHTPIEYQAAEEYLNKSTSSTDVRALQMYKTLQGMVASRLKGRASKTLVGLGRHMQHVCSNGQISKQQLQQALRVFHISLTVEDITQLWIFMNSEQLEISTPMGGSGVCDGSHGNSIDRNLIPIDSVVSGLVGPITEDRLYLIRKAFRKLDSQKCGFIERVQMERFFNATKHPSVLNGQRSSEEVWFALIDCLQGVRKDSSPISYSEFEHYYHGVSIETTKDSDYYVILGNCWAV